MIVLCDPLTLGVLKPPGEFGVDVAVGEGQTLGNRLDFGGPSFGFFAAQEAYLRRMPGRIAGETRDVDGRRGFVLTLQTREQHIRREKATHNICTAQALNALAGVIYLSWLGRRGLVELGELLLQRTAYARSAVAALDGVELLHEQPVIREFAVKLDAPVHAVIDRCAAEGINPGYPARGRRPADRDHRAALARGHRPPRRRPRRRRRGASARRCTHERAQRQPPARRPRPGRDAAAARSPQFETPMQRDHAVTIFEKSKPGRRAFVAPELDVPHQDDLLPEHLRRTEPPKLPEIAEPEIVRHYNRLSKRNFDLDTGFYPLGSCTMKHNPKLHERVAALPGNARLHPAQAPKRAQGALQLMWELQQALGEIAGLPHVSLQPSAGSHGELAGVLLTRAYHEDRGEFRTKVLTPDTAHGTNPATVTMAGYEVVKVGTDERGGVDVDDLRAKADRRRRVPDAHEPEHARALRREHHRDREDRARRRRDALLRRGEPQRRHGPHAPGRHGLRHRPLQPPQDLHAAARRRRPGRRPDRGLGAHRALPAAPAGRAARRRERPRPSFDLDYDRPKSIGRLRGFQGNYGVFVRSYAYILSLGGDGLQEASETAVLNANYLLARLKEEGIAEYLPAAYDRVCMHEFVLSGAPMKKQLGLKTLDLAKRLLDHGFHPPTVYFPLLVDEALLVEPTETETKETLDAFADAIGEILREGAEDPEIARNAPYSTPVRRLDEAAAAKHPVIRQPL